MQKNFEITLCTEETDIVEGPRSDEKCVPDIDEPIHHCRCLIAKRVAKSQHKYLNDDVNTEQRIACELQSRVGLLSRSICIVVRRTQELEEDLRHTPRYGVKCE